MNRDVSTLSRCSRAVCWPDRMVLARPKAWATSAKWSGGNWTDTPFLPRLTWIAPHGHRVIRTLSVFAISECGPQLGLGSDMMVAISAKAVSVQSSGIWVLGVWDLGVWRKANNLPLHLHCPTLPT